MICWKPGCFVLIPQEGSVCRKENFQLYQTWRSSCPSFPVVIPFQLWPLSYIQLRKLGYIPLCPTRITTNMIEGHQSKHSLCRAWIVPESKIEFPTVTSMIFETLLWIEASVQFPRCLKKLKIGFHKTVSCSLGRVLCVAPQQLGRLAEANAARWFNLHSALKTRHLICRMKTPTGSPPPGRGFYGDLQPLSSYILMNWSKAAAHAACSAVRGDQLKK